MRFDRRLKPKTIIDMTPLIDVVFILVLFFMVSSVFKTSPGIELELPESTTTTSVSITELRVVIVSEQEVYLNREMMPLTALNAALIASTEGKTTEDLRVVVEGDKNVSYQLMVSVLDILRKRGIEGVNLVTRVER